jgi:hypothetical protein
MPKRRGVRNTIAAKSTGIANKKINKKRKNDFRFLF